MSTIIDLGQKVKAKYPGQYDDMSDFDVGQKVKAKYPTEYSDFQDVSKPVLPQAKKSVLGKISSGIQKGMDTASNFAFGTFGKTTGGLITQGIASGAQLLGQATGNEKATEFGQKLEKQLGSQGFQPTASDIAFQSLELYPGGGKISEALSKLPGGKQVIEHISSLPDTLKKSAIEQYSKVFNATSKEAKSLVKETVPKLLEKKVTFSSPANLAEKAESMATEYGGKIGEYFKNLPTDAKEATQPILDKLNVFKNQYIVDGKVMRPEAVQATENVMSKISQFGKDISTENARKVRQILDEHFDVSKGIDDISTYTKKAERAGANAIRAEFAKTRPDLDKLNKEFNLWQNVKDLATYSAEKAKGRVVGSGLGSLIGGATGYNKGGIIGGIEGATIGGILGDKAIKLMRSPGWNTVSAVLKNNLADALAKGDKKTIEMLITKITSGSKNIFDALTK